MKRTDLFRSESGPLWPDEAGDITDGAELYLRADAHDVEDEVARQNLRDMAEASFQAWLKLQIAEIQANHEADS